MKTKKSDTLEKQSSIDLGLAVLSAVRKPGERFSQYQIASACGCSQARIFAIEKTALKKLSKALWRDAGLREAVESVIGKTVSLRANSK